MSTLYIRYPSKSSGGGVNIYANLGAFPASSTTGDLGVAADTGILYEFNGVSWQPIGGPGVITSIGTIDTGTASLNGAQDVNNTLVLQSASVTRPGLVNNTTQSFSGNKTFTGTIAASNLSGTNTGDVTLAAVGAVPNASGASLSGQVLTLEPANTSFPGVLTAADWNTFNGKQNALTIGNLTDAGTDGITVTGGTGAVIGSGTSVSQHVADATHNGYLSSTDWTTFNSKQSGTLTSAHLFVGNVSNVAADVAVSGDLTLANTGAFTIANNAVTTVKINNSAVTYAKIQNVSANSVLLGSNATGSGAPPSEITLGSGLSMTGSVLSASGGGSTIGILSKSSAYTAAWTDGVILCTGTFTVTLPTATSTVTRPLMVKNIGTGIITIVPNSGELIDGQSSQILGSQMTAVDLVPDGGTNVYIF